MSFSERQGDLATNQHLTNFAQSFGSKLSKECDKLAPIVPTESDKFEYGVWSKKGGLQRPGMTIRAPGTTAKEFKTEYSIVNDKIVGYSGRIKVPRTDQRNYSGPKTLIEVKTEQMTRFAYDDRRVALATLIAHTNLTYKAARSVLWSAASGTKIFDDINTGVNSVIDNSGKNPNTLGLPRKVARAFRNSAEFIDRYKAWADTVKSGTLPPTIDDMEIVILDTVLDTAQKGQTASLANVWGDQVWIAYVEQSPDPYSLTALSTFRPKDMQDVQIDVYFQDDIKSDWVEYNFYEKIKIVNQECIYVIYNALT